MSENSDKGMAHDEEMTSHLLALLYPDEGESDLEEADYQEADYQDADELSEFRSLLGHFRDLPDEDPPAIVSNKLLALAAQHAPAEKKEKSGQGIFAWLTDFLLPTVYHPGLVSAASLVLVAGLAGTLYVNGKSKVAEPMVATQAVAPSSDSPQGTARLADPAPPAEQAPAAETVALEPALELDRAEEKMMAEEGEQSAVAAPTTDPLKKKTATKSRAAADTGLRQRKGFDLDDNTRDAKLDGRKTGKSVAPAKPRRDFKKGKEETTTPNREQRQNKRPAPKGPAPTSTLSSTVEKKPAAPEPEPSTDPAAPADAPASQPSPPPPSVGGSVEVDKNVAAPGGGESADETTQSEDSAPAQDEASDPSKEAASLHKQAIRAAKKNQCSKVKSLGQQIRKLSSAYYDRSFLSDKRLTDCLAPEVKK